MDYGTKILSELIKDIEKMSIGEYSELFKRASGMRDIKIITDVEQLEDKIFTVVDSGTKIS